MATRETCGTHTATRARWQRCGTASTMSPQSWTPCTKGDGKLSERNSGKAIAWASAECDNAASINRIIIRPSAQNCRPEADPRYQRRPNTNSSSPPSWHAPMVAHRRGEYKSRRVQDDANPTRRLDADAQTFERSTHPGVS